MSLMFEVSFMTTCKSPQGIMIDSQGYVYDQDGKASTVVGLQMLSPLSETEHIDMGLADLEQDLDIEKTRGRLRFS